MDKITINVGKETYPCYPTLGAALYYRDETGRDLEQMRGTADYAVYLYCCAKAACAREKKEFNLSLHEFADRVDITEVQRISEATGATGANASESKKK